MADAGPLRWPRHGVGHQTRQASPARSPAGGGTLPQTQRQPSMSAAVPGSSAIGGDSGRNGQRCLSPAEQRVARELMGGASNRDIAARLFISERTVESHLASMRRKAGQRTTRHLLAWLLANPQDGAEEAPLHRPG
ncbi:MAG: LuxR family transcriptional regulator [Aphanocapsa feldmannii 288cV]|nr:MAG: LuxR family transcriptional regulator [Aphanocapsa feldmannii 288cV]